MSPKLITFEGIDGCGKTTTINAVEEILKNCGFRVYRSYEPGNDFGKMAKFGHPGISHRETVYLWWLARKYEQNIFTNAEYDIILKDRYYDSTWVYQHLEGSTLEMHNFDENYFTKPYHTVYLKVSPEVSIQRMGGERPQDLYETNRIDVLKRRCDLFDKIIEKHKGWRSFSIIDTDNMTPNEVIGMAANHILRRIDGHLDFTPGEEDEQSDHSS